MTFGSVTGQGKKWCINSGSDRSLLSAASLQFISGLGYFLLHFLPSLIWPVPTYQPAIPYHMTATNQASSETCESSHIFLNCCSCCITGKRNTHWGKRYPPSSTYMRSQTPMTDWCGCDWQGIPLPPRQHGSFRKVKTSSSLFPVPIHTTSLN